MQRWKDSFVLRAILLMTLIVSPARAEPVLGDEVELPIYAARDSYTPAAAYGGGVFLVVWQAGRIGAGDLRQGLSGLQEGDIVGIRVGPDGSVLDQQPFVICSAAGMQAAPRAAFGGGEFLVVWHDLRNGKDWDVYAARIKPDGTVLDSSGFPVVEHDRNQANPRAAWNGEEFVVVWQDFRNGHHYEIYYNRVGADGQVTHAGGSVVASGAEDGRHYFNPSVAPAGQGRSFVFWPVMVWSGAKGSTPRAMNAFLQQDTVVDGQGYITSEHGPGWEAVPASMAAGGTTFLVAWTTEAPAGRGNADNGSNAMILDGQVNIVARLFVNGDEQRIQVPEVAWEGTEYVVAWQQTSFENPPHYGPYMIVKTSRVSEDGQVRAVAVVSGSKERPAAEPAVAADGNGHSLIAYELHPASGDNPIRIAFRIASGR